jgi:hypothetical protein
LKKAFITIRLVCLIDTSFVFGIVAADLEPMNQLLHVSGRRFLLRTCANPLKKRALVSRGRQAGQRPLI